MISLLFASFLICQVLSKGLEFPATVNENGIQVPSENGYATEVPLQPAHNREDLMRILWNPVMKEFNNYLSEKNVTVKPGRRKRNVKVDNIYNKLKKHLVNLNGKNCNLKNQDLNYILDVKTTDGLEFICKNRNKLVVIGKRVTFQSLVSKTCEDKIKHIEIFATETLVIDDDLVRPGDGLHLSIIAKRWEIKGNRKIILDGAPAKLRSTPEQAAEGNCAGCKGEDGQSGLPGGNAGHFFGIGSSFVNGKNLVISAHGGDGSPGHHGGDGADGANGKDAELPKSPSAFYNGLETSEFQYSKTGKQVLVPFSVYYMTYTFHGTTGSKGGHGGNGGDGGMGGMAGEIKMCELDNYSEIVRQAYRGKTGLAGKGGSGGNAGRRGSDVQADIQFRQLNFKYEIIDKWENVLVIKENNEFDGNSGSNGGYGPGHFPGRGGGNFPWHGHGHRHGHGPNHGRHGHNPNHGRHGHGPNHGRHGGWGRHG